MPENAASVGDIITTPSPLITTTVAATTTSVNATEAATPIIEQTHNTGKLTSFQRWHGRATPWRSL